MNRFSREIIAMTMMKHVVDTSHCVNQRHSYDGSRPQNCCIEGFGDTPGTRLCSQMSVTVSDLIFRSLYLEPQIAKLKT